MQDDGCASLPQDCRHVLVCLAGVDYDGLSRPGAQLDLRLEGRALGLPGRVVVMVVEASLDRKSVV